MTQQPTRPNAETRDAEREEADRPAGADREPTTDEAERADAHAPDPEVADHEREMADRGANQEGEGRLP
jgi:hypothetical protein